MSSPLSPSESASVYNGNGTGNTIPPRSVILATQVTTVSATNTQEQYTYLAANKFTWGNPGIIMVTGDSPIYPGQYGLAFLDRLIFVAIDQTVSTPQVGEQWGPVNSSYTISRGGMGFFAVGYPSSNGDPTKAMFVRDRGYSIGKFAGSMTAGSAAVPTTATVNTWHPDPTLTGLSRQLVQASASGLAGIEVTNYDSSWTALVNYFCEFKREDDGRCTLTSIGCSAS